MSLFSIQIGVIFISKYLFNSHIILFIIIIFISIFFIPIIAGASNSNNSSFTDNGEIINFNPNGFVWPIPGYTRISSPFGKRTSPTAGASSFHYGCDIPAPQGTKLIAVADGEITFRQFLGARWLHNYSFFF